MLRAAGLYGHIRNNNIKSALLLAGFVVLVGLVWMAVTLVWTVLADKFLSIGIRLETNHNPTETEVAGLMFQHWLERTMRYGFVPLFAVAGWFAYAYAARGRLIRRATGAHPISRQLEWRLYNLVETLSITAGMTMPRVEIIETQALNAYASGLGPDDATVAVTRGLLDTLNDDELEAVLAHEITHIRNRDVRLMVIATIFVGVLAYVGEMMRRQTSNGAIGRSVGGGDFVVVAVATMVAMLAGLFGVLTRLALSRSREYLADAGSAELTKNPEALISALRWIEGRAAIEGLPPSMEAMMISARIDGLFATHPATDDRIAALQNYAGARAGASRALAPGREAVRAPAGAVLSPVPAAPGERTFGKRKPR